MIGVRLDVGCEDCFDDLGAAYSEIFALVNQFIDEPFEEVVYDKPREGRPSELSDKEHDQFVEALHDSPEEVGYDAPAWTVPLARHYLAEEFDVEYCERHVRRLISEAVLSWKTARPEFYKSDERAQEAWQEGFKKSATTWTMNTRS